eukprot:gene33271-40253_t
MGAEVGGAYHRTFSSHLIFFLEGLLVRWSPHCSSMRVSFSFQSRGAVLYTSRSPRPGMAASSAGPRAGAGTGRFSQSAHLIMSRLMQTQQTVASDAEPEQQQTQEVSAGSASPGNTSGAVSSNTVPPLQSIYKSNNPFTLPSLALGNSTNTRGNAGGLNLGMGHGVSTLLGANGEEWVSGSGSSDAVRANAGDSAVPGRKQQVVYGYLRVSFTPLDVEPSACSSSSGTPPPHPSSQVLLSVLSEFLGGLDAGALAVYMGEPDEEAALQGQGGYLLSLPCHFLLLPDEQKLKDSLPQPHYVIGERGAKMRSRPAVGRTINNSNRPAPAQPQPQAHASALVTATPPTSKMLRMFEDDEDNSDKAKDESDAPLGCEAASVEPSLARSNSNHSARSGGGASRPTPVSLSKPIVLVTSSASSAAAGGAGADVTDDSTVSSKSETSPANSGSAKDSAEAKAADGGTGSSNSNKASNKLLASQKLIRSSSHDDLPPITSPAGAGAGSSGCFAGLGWMWRAVFGLFGIEDKEESTLVSPPPVTLKSMPTLDPCTSPSPTPGLVSATALPAKRSFVGGRGGGRGGSRPSFRPLLAPIPSVSSLDRGPSEDDGDKAAGGVTVGLGGMRKPSFTFKNNSVTPN